MTAFSSPLNTDWRWRIISFEGDMVAESHQAFATIAAAVAHGTQRLIEMNVVNRAELDRTYRWNSQLWRR